jgi:hypothetical protein
MLHCGASVFFRDVTMSGTTPDTWPRRRPRAAIDHHVQALGLGKATDCPTLRPKARPDLLCVSVLTLTSETILRDRCDELAASLA